MSKIKPNPPPVRLLHPFLGWINEEDTINWYTELGKPYPHPVSSIRMMFNKGLKQAYEKNLKETE